MVCLVWLTQLVTNHITVSEHTGDRGKLNVQIESVVLSSCVCMYDGDQEFLCLNYQR